MLQRAGSRTNGMKTSTSRAHAAGICPIALALLAAPLATQMAGTQPATAPGLERLPDSEWTLDAARHLLFRAGFGGTPEDVKSLHRRGLDGAMD